MAGDEGSVVDPQTKAEEAANSITHGIAAALAVAGLVLLAAFASRQGDAWKVTSLAVYGATLIILFVMSTLSHAIIGKKLKRFFELLDYSSIYLLIAGTYTPIMLVYLRGPWGWTMFGVVWVMALVGILCKVFLLGRWDFLSVVFYVLMGWMLVIVFRPLMLHAPAGFIKWLVIGGLCYTLGSLFYLFKRMPFHHPVWHIFVIAGSACHFFGFLFYMALK
jgi:hemolysin III